MGESEDIKRMREEVSRREKALDDKQRNCKHEFGEPTYDPEKVVNWQYTHLEPNGSDPIPRGDTYTTDKPRWTRICKLCEKVEHTNKQSPTGPMEPKF